MARTQPKTLKFKVVLYLAIALSVAMLLFTVLVAWFMHKEILGKVSDHVIQLSEVISQEHRASPCCRTSPPMSTRSSTTWPIRSKSTGSES